MGERICCLLIFAWHMHVYSLVSGSLFAGAVREGLKWADGKLVKGTVDNQVRTL